VLCAGFAAAAAAQTKYTVTDLGTLSGSSSAKVADINKSGQIVGTSADHAFLWSNGMMTDLGTLGGTRSAVHAINDQGVVVGEASTASGEMHAFVWQNGVMKDLAGETSSARGINSSGDIVGVASAKNVRGGAVLWSGGQRQFIGDLGPSGSGSQLASLPGSMTSAGTGTQAAAVNDSGQIVGSCVTSSGNTHAVIWSNGKIADLNSLIPQVTGMTLTRATGINRAGQIVVEQQTNLDGPTTRAFLLTPRQH